MRSSGANLARRFQNQQFFPPSRLPVTPNLLTPMPLSGRFSERNSQEHVADGVRNFGFDLSAEHDIGLFVGLGRRALTVVAIRARVERGRLVVDAPTSLPEGTVLDLVVDDEGDDLDETERVALNAAISRAWASTRAGQVRPAQEVLAALRKR